MNVLIYLVPMALGLGLLGLFGFLWALRSGQYSDVDGAAQRVLLDDDVNGRALHQSRSLATH
ncbi:MAG: cbb3-type cytochrome oxidase assembly protein CcoS [Pseudolabrys sp.]